MSAENVERAKDMWLGDFDLTKMVEGGPDAVAAVFPTLRADVKSEFIAQNPEASQSYKGIEGLYEGWREWIEPWSSYSIRMNEMIEAGPHEFVVMGRAEARTSRDAVLMEHRPAAILTLDADGLVTWVRFFLDSDDALRAAGVDSA